MANAIPQRNRYLVIERDRVCLRCGARGAEWHHRRTRSHRDEHTHCPANGVYLCLTCHRQVHAHPLVARATGFIVARWDDPHLVPIRTYYRAQLILDCAGGFSLYATPTEERLESDEPDAEDPRRLDPWGSS